MIRTGGFSLIELMVSMAIGTVVILLAVSAMSTVGDGYGRNTSSVAAEVEARAVLTIAADDLSRAVRGREMVLGDGNTEGWQRGRLGFLSLQPEGAQSEEDRLGDLCAVVYYTQDLQLGSKTVRCLMRGFRNSGETMGALREDRVGSLYDANTTRDEPVAFGVLSFGVEPLLRTDSGTWVDWEKESDTGWRGPDSVRIRLVVARRELLGKLNRPEDWDSSPLLGEPDEVQNSSNVEVYEIVEAFAHDR